MHTTGIAFTCVEPSVFTDLECLHCAEEIEATSGRERHRAVVTIDGRLARAVGRVYTRCSSGLTKPFLLSTISRHPHPPVLEILLFSLGWILECIKFLSLHSLLMSDFKSKLFYGNDGLKPLIH